MQEFFHEYPTTGVLWMDSSFRLLSGDFSNFTHKILENGLYTFTATSHSVYAATHPQMYSFLPTDIQGLKSLSMLGANSMVIYPTRKVYHRFLYWWYLCALDVNCQAPLDITRPCPLVHKTGGDRKNLYYHFCHRFDQSSMNILLANTFGYDINNHLVHGLTIVSIQRNQKNFSNATLRICSRKDWQTDWTAHKWKRYGNTWTGFVTTLTNSMYWKCGKMIPITDLPLDVHQHST